MLFRATNRSVVKLQRQPGRRGRSVSQRLLVLAIRKCFLPLSSPPTTPGHTKTATLAGRDAQMAASKLHAKLTAKAPRWAAPTADVHDGKTGFVHFCDACRTVSMTPGEETGRLTTTKDLKAPIHTPL